MTVYGARALRQLQIGEEAERGTAVAATAALLGILTMREPRGIEFPLDEVGALTEATRIIHTSTGPVEMAYEADLTFEQVLYLLHMGVKGNITPAQQDAGTAYLWTFTPSLLASPAPDSFTIEHGDNLQAFEAEYCMARQLEFSGAVNEALRMRADIFGKQMSTCDFTAALNPPTVESAVFGGCKLYIDDAWGSLGGSELAASLISFNWRLITGFEPEKMADATKFFTRHLEKAHRVELEMVLRFHTNSYAERAKWAAGTSRAIRIESIGSQIAAEGVYRYIKLDTLMKYTGDGWGVLEDREGADVVSVKLQSVADVANNNEFSVGVMAAVSTLP